MASLVIVQERQSCQTTMLAADGWSAYHRALGRHGEHAAGREILAIDITPGVAATAAPAPPDDELAANRRSLRTAARPGNGKLAGHDLCRHGASSVSAGRPCGVASQSSHHR